MGNTQAKIQEVITATANAPPAISISAELFILVCVITTIIVLAKYFKKYIKTQIKRQTIRGAISKV